MWSPDYVQVPKDETPLAQTVVQQQVTAAKESEEESADDEAAMPAPLQRQGSLCSLPISCGSENESGPDSTSSPVSPSAEPSDKLTEKPLLRSSRDHRTVLAGDARGRVRPFSGRPLAARRTCTKCRAD